MLTFTFTLTVFPSTCLGLGYCYCVSLYFLFLFLPYVLCLVAVCQRELKSWLIDWRRWRKTGDDWMSNGNELQRSDVATKNVRRPTVLSRNGGTVSWCDDDERSRRRPGRSATRTRSFRSGGRRPCSTRNAMTATLKSTRCGRRSQRGVARASETWS